MIDFFVERIRFGAELRREDVESDYRPVPFVHMTTPFIVEGADPGERHRALTQVAELALDSHSLDTYDVPSLFALMANGFDDLSIQVLEELIDREGRYGVMAAVRLLREAPKRILFDRSGFLDRLLTAAERAGADEYSRVQSALIGIAWQAPRLPSATNRPRRSQSREIAPFRPQHNGQNRAQVGHFTRHWLVAALDRQNELDRQIREAHAY